MADLRGLSKGGSVEKVQRTLNEVVGEMQKDEPKATAAKPIPVIVQPPSPLLARLPGLLDVLAATGVVTVLVIFMLFERQDLRDRLIRLVGYRRVTVTTRALDEATARITKYLLIQSVINGGFGLSLGIALFLLGVPYAALWGVLGAALRFIPYVGAAIAMLLPTALALAVFPGWSRALLIVGVFLALELTAYMVVEPWLYGQSAGVSPVALLVAVIFWTWLWGSVGLLLATPLTVCLIVLSKHLPSMGFLVLLMGDDPVLEPKARYYQRLLARDQDEAADIVEEYVKANDPASVYDEVLLPALYYAKQDSERERSARRTPNSWPMRRERSWRTWTRTVRARQPRRRKRRRAASSRGASCSCVRPATRSTPWPSRSPAGSSTRPAGKSRSSDRPC